MKKTHFYKKLIIFIISIAILGFGYIIYLLSTPTYQVKRAFHNTFSSLNDTMLSAYWNNSMPSSAYKQDFTISLKDCTYQDMDFASYLSGLQIDCSAITDSATMQSYGEYFCAYSAMPIISGNFLLTKDALFLSSPDLFNGSLSFPTKNTLSVLNNPIIKDNFSDVPFENNVDFINIPSNLLAIQPEVHHFYDNFYRNHFEKTNNNIILQTNDISMNCTSYQLILNEESLSSLEHIMSFLRDNTLEALSDNFIAQHSELEPFFHSSLISNASFTLSIDSKHIIRQIQCIILSGDNSYHYTFVLTSDDGSLSSWILSCSSSSFASHNVQSYCKLIKKEPCAYVFLAQGSDTSIVNSFTFTMNQEHGYIHDYSSIDYHYQIASDNIPALHTILYDATHDTNLVTDKLLLCNGTMQYYMTYNSSNHHLELNIESLTMQFPANNLSFTTSLRYNQESTDIGKPAAMSEPVYSLDSISKEQFDELQKEFQDNIAKSSVWNMILSVLH